MLKPFDYELLRQFTRYNVDWTVRLLATLLGVKYNRVDSRVTSLLNAQYLYTTGKMRGDKYGHEPVYAITETGREALADARKTARATQSTQQWIRRARAGIDSNGHQTHLDKVAIPKPQAHPHSYEIDFEDWIDRKRAGELDE